MTSGDDGGGTCTRCGYAAGEASRCPHCSAIARTEGRGTSAVCAVCGGPRIPSGLGGSIAKYALVEQKRWLGTARVASFTTIVRGVFAVIMTLGVLATLGASSVATLVGSALAAGLLVLTVVGRARAVAAREKAREANDRAWQAAAEEAAAQKPGGIAARELAESFGIDEAYADKLLTALAVHDRTRIDVGDDAEIRYSAAPAEAEEAPPPDAHATGAVRRLP